MATCAAVPVLRRKVAVPGGTFRLPGGLLIPGLALMVCVAIIAGADRTSLLGGGAALIVGAVLYLVSVGASGGVSSAR